MKPASFIVDGNFQVELFRNWIVLVGILISEYMEF